MFNFNLKETAIFQTVKRERHPAFRFDKPLKKIFLALFIIAFPLFLYGFLTQTFSERFCQILFGFSIIFLVLTIEKWQKEVFLNSKLKKPKLSITIDEAISYPEEYNLAEFLSFEAARAVWGSLRFAKSRKLPEINSTILSYFILRDNPKLGFVFSRALLNLNDVKEIFRKEIFNLSKTEFPFMETRGKKSAKKSFSSFVSSSVRRTKSSSPAVFDEQYSLDFQNSILESLQIASKKGNLRIEIGDILTVLTKNNQIFKKILIEANLKVEDIENLTSWLEDLEKKIAENQRFWEWKNLLKLGSLAKEWAAGYTVLLDQFSIDVTELMRRQGFREIFAHKEEVQTLEIILARTEINNVLIVGESGSARRSMIEALANRCALGESLPELNYKRVVILDLPKILAITKDTEEAEGILDEIFGEVVYAGNVILVIDNIHNYVGVATERRAGIVEISGALSSYLALPSFPFIGITTFEGLHINIEQNSGLLSLFEKVEVSEISGKETLLILKDRALRFEGKYKIIVSFAALRDIVSLTARYLSNLPFPEKAMQLLDEVMVYVASRKKKIVLPEDIASIITGKTQIPVGEIEIKEKEILLNLENSIHQRIINQEEAVKGVSDALRRARAEVTVRKGPMGCFLFLGPTGVGKTETSKALSEIYFGSEEKMIRLDMSEFQAIKDISRLIGSVGERGLLTTPVRENPFSLVLLDEFEKGHPDILNLFLQVFDEGRLTDGMGRKVDFKNAIIIATSNAGYQVILQVLKEITEGGPFLVEKPVGRSQEVWDVVKKRLLDFIFEKGIFRPELINRFDGVIVFRPLTKENLLDIAELLLQKLKKNLKEKEIEFIITQPLKEKIVDLGYDPVFGARAMRRVIQDKVENVLASALLAVKIKRGDRVGIDPKEFELVINP